MHRKTNPITDMKDHPNIATMDMETFSMAIMILHLPHPIHFIIICFFLTEHYEMPLTQTTMRLHILP